MNRFATVVSLLAALCMLSACNTVQGVGKDLKKAGEKIEEAAKQ